MFGLPTSPRQRRPPAATSFQCFLSLTVARPQSAGREFPFGGNMPNYNAQVPPYSVFPGDVALAFNSEAPGAGQGSQQFALPNYSGFPENGRTIRWQTIYGSAPSAISVTLQTAMTDADAQYTTIDTSTATAGE